MGRRHALTGVVVVVGGIALLWCARLVLRADLTTGTTLAAVALWLLAAGAVATLAAYVREVERHRAERRGSERARRRASAKPLPGLVLLWVAGLTALAVFPFMLAESSAAGSTTADPDSTPAGHAVDSPGTPTTSTRVPTRTSPTSSSRGATRTPSPSSTTSAAARTTPRPVTTSTTAATVRPSTTTTTAPRPTTSTTTTGPLITITVPPVRTKGH